MYIQDRQVSKPVRFRLVNLLLHDQEPKRVEGKGFFPPLHNQTCNYIMRPERDQ